MSRSYDDRRKLKESTLIDIEKFAPREYKPEESNVILKKRIRTVHTLYEEVPKRKILNRR